MRTSKICALLGRGAIVAVLGMATVAVAASPASARISLEDGAVTRTPFTFEWGSAPASVPADEPADTGLEERTFEWG